MDAITSRIMATVESTTHCSPSIAESIAVGIVAALQDPAIIESIKESIKD